MIKKQTSEEDRKPGICQHKQDDSMDHQVENEDPIFCYHLDES